MPLNIRHRLQYITIIYYYYNNDNDKENTIIVYIYIYIYRERERDTNGTAWLPGARRLSRRATWSPSGVSWGSDSIRYHTLSLWCDMMFNIPLSLSLYIYIYTCMCVIAFNIILQLKPDIISYHITSHRRGTGTRAARPLSYPWQATGVLAPLSLSLYICMYTYIYI